MRCGERQPSTKEGEEAGWAGQEKARAPWSTKKILLSYVFPHSLGLWSSHPGCSDTGE